MVKAPVGWAGSAGTMRTKSPLSKKTAKTSMPFTASELAQWRNTAIAGVLRKSFINRTLDMINQFHPDLFIF